MLKMNTQALSRSVWFELHASVASLSAFSPQRREGNAKIQSCRTVGWLTSFNITPGWPGQWVRDCKGMVQNEKNWRHHSFVGSDGGGGGGQWWSNFVSYERCGEKKKLSRNVNALGHFVINPKGVVVVGVFLTLVPFFSDQQRQQHSQIRTLCPFFRDDLNAQKKKKQFPDTFWPQQKGERKPKTNGNKMASPGSARWVWCDKVSIYGKK